MQAFNINSHVWVKLTDKGRAIHKQKWEQVHASLGWDYRPVEEDADGWSEWQLWCLMELFGEHCHNGMNIPFETTIKLETPNP